MQSEFASLCQADVLLHMNYNKHNVGVNTISFLCVHGQEHLKLERCINIISVRVLPFNNVYPILPSLLNTVEKQGKTNHLLRFRLREAPGYGSLSPDTGTLI